MVRFAGAQDRCGGEADYADKQSQTLPYKIAEPALKRP